MPPELDPLFRQNYLEELAGRAGKAQVFTNTHPGRIVGAARMATAVPGVRFIFVKRNAEDLALRIYMRYYKSGLAYAYDLHAIFRFVEWYNSMMDGIAVRFPAIVRIIAYEDMIADPSTALGAVAQLCSLPMPDGELPELGDDRGAAAPYREFMQRALARQSS